MAEPTIEGWNAQARCPKCGGWAYVTANTEGESALIAQTEAEIIRAFVERVGERFLKESGLYIEIVADELAKMEKQ